MRDGRNLARAPAEAAPGRSSRLRTALVGVVAVLVIGGGGLAGGMHGDFVASDGNGGQVTRRPQTGTVTAGAPRRSRRRAPAGHATTFVVTSSTTAGGAASTDVRVGDTVTVVGALSGGTATATSISDSPLDQAAGDQQGGRPPSD